MAYILKPEYMLPVRPRGKVFENHAVAVNDGRIAMVGPAQQVIDAFPGAETITLGQHVLLPGLINMHTHSPMTLLRGYADDLRLDTWLNDHIWPAEHRWANGEFVYDGIHLAMAEMLRGGISCFNEMYFYPDRMAEAVDESGMRVCMGIPVIDFETGWAASPEEYLEKGMAVRAQFEGNDRISFSIAPHSMYSVSSKMLGRIGQASSDLDIPVHLHLLEIAWEIENSLEKYNVTPLQRVQELGLLNNRLIAIHMAHLEDTDINLLATHNVNVVHCPQSNLKLASGLCRASDLIDQGVNLCIGTDGAAANNDLDLLEELRTASLLAKGVSGNPKTFDAVFALDTVTMNSAKALGLESKIGSIEEGKYADFCAIDLAHVRTQPVHNVTSQVIYAAAASQVTDVWVAGKRLLKNHKLTTLDEQGILDNAGQWSARMRPEINVKEAVSKWVINP